MIGGDQKLLLGRLDGDEMAVVIIKKPLGGARLRVVHVSDALRMPEIGVEILPEPFFRRFFVRPRLGPRDEPSKVIVMKRDAGRDVILDGQKLLHLSSRVVPKSSHFLLRVLLLPDLPNAPADIVVQNLERIVRFTGQDLFDPVSFVVLERHFANGAIFEANQVSVFVESGSEKINF